MVPEIWPKHELGALVRISKELLGSVPEVLEHAVSELPAENDESQDVLCGYPPEHGVPVNLWRGGEMV